MKHLIYHFLKQHWDGHSPLLLALSGGPDSLALFHLLAEEKRLRPRIGIAHIDHGWRACSQSEAMQLQELAKVHSMPFHLKVLQPHTLAGNLEEACRKQRLLFFRELTQAFGYQAVLLGHHADDQAETVLKKIFENVSLPQLHGLQLASSYEGLHLWRPLLSIRKEAILDFLHKRQLVAFDDYTNQDVRFLRARMRKNLFPSFRAQFGKEISPALCHLSIEALELRDYLHKNIQSYLLHIDEGSMGYMLDLTKECPSASIELRYLIRTFCRQAQFALSHTLLDNIIALIISNQANKKVQMHHKQLFIDRRRLFIPKSALERPSASQKISLGHFVYGPWQGSLNLSSAAKPPTSWLQAWKGHISVYLPLGEYCLAPIKPSYGYAGSSSIDKWWNKQKVPAFLRYCLPAVYRLEAIGIGQELAHEFLTGHPPFSFKLEEIPP